MATVCGGFPDDHWDKKKSRRRSIMKNPRSPLKDSAQISGKKGLFSAEDHCCTTAVHR